MFIINYGHETLVIVRYLNYVIIVHDVIIDWDSFDEVTAGGVSADLIVSDISGNNNTQCVIITEKV